MKCFIFCLIDADGNRITGQSFRGTAQSRLNGLLGKANNCVVITE
jgi:hypothetical protein